MTERQSNDEDVVSIYQSGDKLVTLCQMANDDVLNLNTEYSSPEEVKINDCNGIFISENDGNCGVVWIMDGYLFMLNGKIDKNSLIELAETTKLEIELENP